MCFEVFPFLYKRIKMEQRLFYSYQISWNLKLPQVYFQFFHSKGQCFGTSKETMFTCVYCIKEKYEPKG